MHELVGCIVLQVVGCIVLQREGGVDAGWREQAMCRERMFGALTAVAARGFMADLAERRTMPMYLEIS